MRKIVVLKKRKVEADKIFNSVWVSKLINTIMIGGKKSIAASIVYDSINAVIKELQTEFTTLKEKIKTNVSPKKGTLKFKFGGATYDVPYELTSSQSHNKGIKFIVKCARAMLETKRDQFGRVTSKKKHKTITSALTEVLKGVFNGNSEAIKMKEAQEKLANDNAAFAHLSTKKSHHKKPMNKKPKKVTESQNTEVVEEQTMEAINVSEQ